MKDIFETKFFFWKNCCKLQQNKTNSQFPIESTKMILQTKER